MTRVGDGTNSSSATDLALRRGAIALAVLLACLTLLPGLGRTPLVDWDEGIYAEVARGVHEGSPWRLTWNGQAYDRKPPLLFWAIAASYEVFGVSEAAARLPSALAGVATVGVVAAIVAARSGPLPALLAAACLLGSTMFLERGGRRACTDSLVILFSVIALWRATERPNTWRGMIEAGVAVGLAILSKGLLGLLAPLALFAAAPLRRARWREVAGLLVVGGLVALPWYATQLWLGGSQFVASHVGFELVERAIRPIHGGGAPWWYPPYVVWETGGRWTVIVVACALLRVVTAREARDVLLPWLCAAAIVLGAAMTMQTKLPWYPLPALPMLAVAAGLAVARFGRVVWVPARVVACALLAIAAADALALTQHARRAVLDDELQFEPFRDLGTTIASALGEEPFIGATRENPTLIFYGRRPIRVFDEEELTRQLRDPDSMLRAGLLPVAAAEPLLVGGGAEEIARFGDHVLVRMAPMSFLPDDSFDAETTSSDA